MIVVVAGVTGSGKTTVGTLLADRLGWSFTDGDALHPAANIAKLSAGQPLSDEDRRPWLRAIATWMDQRIGAGQRTVIACSALKRDYRDQLLDGRPAAVMAFLEIGEDAAASRLASRQGHFCDPTILDSQFADLEPPSRDERSVVVVPADRAPGQLAGQIIGLLSLPG